MLKVKKEKGKPRRMKLRRDRKRIAWRFGTTQDLATLTEEEYELIRERKR